MVLGRATLLITVLHLRFSSTMNPSKMARSAAAVLVVACFLWAPSSAAPSVFKGNGQYGGPWNDDLTDQQQSQGVAELQSPYDYSDIDVSYQNSGEYGADGGFQQSQSEAGRGNYASKDDHDDSDEDSTWSRSWDALTDWGANAAANVASGAREFGSNVVDAAAGLWNKVDDTFDDAWDHFKSGLKHLGDNIQQGAVYCAHVLQQKSDEVQSSEFLQKLLNKVEEGNDDVMEFFQVLGQKIEQWSDEHPDDSSIDDGFSSESELYQQGAVRHEQFQREGFPDLFQDSEVQGEIEKLVDYGVIQQKEADLLVQQQRQW